MRSVFVAMWMVLSAGTLAQPATDEGSEAGTSSADTLAEAQALYDALEYDRVIPLTKQVLAGEDVSREQKLQAYLLQGMSLAIVGDPVEAEGPFRLLLREDITFDLPDNTPPKILQAWRKVQAEERALYEEEEKMRIERISRQMEFRGEPPPTLEGGRPLRFHFGIKDPSSVIDGVRVLYRKQGEAGYSSLALKRGDDGGWVGAVPGEWTANEEGLVVELYLEADGLGRVLKRKGAPDAPLYVTVSSGTAELSAPPPVPLWGFLTAAGGTALLGAGTLAVAAAVGGLQLEYWNAVGRLSLFGPAATEIPGEQVMLRATVLTGMAITFWVVLGATAVAGAGTGVVSLFTNFAGEEAVEY